MPMPTAPNQTPIGNQLYFFQSVNAATTDCLVLAHGSISHPKPNFMVPAPITVHFYTTPREAFSPVGGVTGAAKRNPASHRGTRQTSVMDYTQGMVCDDYRLEKVVGRHEHHDARGNPIANPEADTSYVQLHELMQHAARSIVSDHWTPHIVTVRFRSKFHGGPTIKLSRLINQVMQARPALLDIYVAACRVEFRNGVRLPL